MNPPGRPGALIFDLDGTLVDTEPLYSVATQRVLDEFGGIYTEALKRRCMGRPSHDSARIVIDAFGLPMDADEYLARREVHLIELFRSCPEIPGASAFVTTAHASGLALGLATSSHAHLRDIKLDDKPWASLFQASVCGDHPDLEHGKPAPDIFLLCARELSIAPADCMVFEDSRNGVEGARAAGMTVIGIDSIHVTPGDLAGAHHIIDDFTDALPWLDAWQAR